MNLTLFIFYFVLIGFIFTNSKFYKESGLTSKNLFLLFGIKVLAGFYYSYYFSSPNQIENADTWGYFIESKMETDWLLKNPKNFFLDLFCYNYSSTGSLFASYNSYWNDLKSTFFIKILAILNILSNKNYYINLLFFNLGFMYGSVAFYKIISSKFKINKWIILTALLSPSFLFWCSAIHKDGIIFCGVSLSLYCFSKILSKDHNFKHIIVLIFSLLVIFMLRNYYLLALIPAFTGWFISSKLKVKTLFIFTSLSLVCISFVFISPNLLYLNSLSSSIVTKHNEFLSIDGNTKIITPYLENSTLSLLTYLPFAFKTSIFTPNILNVRTFGECLISIENYFFILITLISIFIMLVYKISLPHEIILYCMVTITFFLLLFIGYTVCFEAAIVRYRSVFSPFYLIPSLVIINHFWTSKNQRRLMK